METHKNVLNEVYSFNLSSLTSGTYFVYVKSDEGNESKTFIKE
jgi:hypothetical protein